jgi:peptide subunit release factor 1 (eRF1)
MNLRERLVELARIERAETPVISVYLNTHWADEHQRDRVRVFLKNELAKARRASSGRAAEGDLDWIEREGEALVAQSRFPDGHGVALFACQALHLHEVLPLRVPFPDRFVVAEAPFLRPLAAVLAENPSTLVVFVNTESARLIPLTIEEAVEEVVLESDVASRHSSVGWIQMAETQYQQYIRNHRARHFEGVIESLVALAERHGVERIVLAGEAKHVAQFRRILPWRMKGLVAGVVAGTRDESAGVITTRAATLVTHLEGHEQGIAIDALLTDAAKGGQAVASLDETLEAVNRGAVRRLYLLSAFSQAGRFCLRCASLQRGPDLICRLCGNEAKPVELADALVDRVIASGGEVETVDVHEALGRVGGVAALLRYPL